jgi:hypothetical protein
VVPTGTTKSTTGNNRLRARLASLVCPTYSAPSSHRLPCKRMRRQSLALRVTRRLFRSHDAEANASFCHARVVYSIGQERRATATGTLSANSKPYEELMDVYAFATWHRTPSCWVRTGADGMRQNCVLGAVASDVEAESPLPKDEPGPAQSFGITLSIEQRSFEKSRDGP